MASCLDIPLKPIQWTLCCLCQSQLSEKLQKPTAKGLVSLETDLHALDKLGALPYNINLCQLDNGSGIASTPESHNAVYHKSCRGGCNATQVKRARDKVDKLNSDSVGDNSKKLRSSHTQPDLNSDECACVVCESPSGELHKVSCMNVDKNLKDWSLKIKNYHLHARLITDASDAHAADIYYHTVCYTNLRYEANRSSTSEPAGCPLSPFDPMVIAQLVLYMTDSTEAFKLSTLQFLYKKKLDELGRTCPKLNATRFKEHLLKHLPPGWASFTRGKHVYLSHSANVGEALAQSLQQSEIDQDDALLLMRGVGILREHALVRKDPFTGSFASDCFSRPVPEPLLTFMDVLLQGPKVNMEGPQQYDAGMDQRSKVACGICQLVIYNMVKYTSSSDTAVQMRHRRERETPFPLYIGIKMHSDSRLKHLVQTFHNLGLSVSYERVREVKIAVARSVCKRIEEDGVVLPTNMRSGVFTTGDFDNLDHKKTSNLSNDEFHGVAISLTNHLSQENMGVTREPVTIDPTDTSTPKLPDYYVIVPPMDLTGGELFVPRDVDTRTVRPAHDRIPGSQGRDEAWLDHVSGLISKEELQKGDVVTWSGFNSSLEDASAIKPPAEIGILPIFPDKSMDPPLVKHVMLLVQKCIQFLNPGQTPVIGADQPLYALAKQIQWKFPAVLGEDKYVVLMGALHIEDKGQLMLGKCH